MDILKTSPVGEATGKIIKYDFCEPLVHSYGKGSKTYVFKDTKTIMLVSEDCPPNIIELLPYHQLCRILTDEQLEEIYPTDENVYRKGI